MEITSSRTSSPRSKPPRSNQALEHQLTAYEKEEEGEEKKKEERRKKKKRKKKKKKKMKDAIQIVEVTIKPFFSFSLFFLTIRFIITISFISFISSNVLMNLFEWRLIGFNSRWITDQERHVTLSALALLNRREEQIITEGAESIIYQLRQFPMF